MDTYETVMFIFWKWVLTLCLIFAPPTLNPNIMQANCVVEWMDLFFLIGMTIYEFYLQNDFISLIDVILSIAVDGVILLSFLYVSLNSAVVYNALLEAIFISIIITIGSYKLFFNAYYSNNPNTSDESDEFFVQNNARYDKIKMKDRQDSSQKAIVQKKAKVSTTKRRKQYNERKREEKKIRTEKKKRTKKKKRRK